LAARKKEKGGRTKSMPAKQSVGKDWGKNFRDVSAGARQSPWSVVAEVLKWKRQGHNRGENRRLGNSKLSKRGKSHWTQLEQGNGTKRTREENSRRGGEKSKKKNGLGGRWGVQPANRG